MPLYGIDLNPDGTASTTPAGGFPNESLGGSDVGANEQDDQRVRDLIGQEIFELLQDVNNLINTPVSSGNNPTSWSGLGDVTYTGVGDSTLTGLPVDLTFAGPDQMVDITGILSVLLNSSALTSILATITMDVYIDGNLFQTYDIYREPEVTGQTINDRDPYIVRIQMQQTPGEHELQVDFNVAGDNTETWSVDVINQVAVVWEFPPTSGPV